MWSWSRAFSHSQFAPLALSFSTWWSLQPHVDLFSSLLLLNSISGRVKEAPEHSERKPAGWSCSSEVQYRCCYISALKCLIFWWNRWIWGFHIFASNLLLSGFFSWTYEVLRSSYLQLWWQICDELVCALITGNSEFSLWWGFHFVKHANESGKV